MEKEVYHNQDVVKGDVAPGQDETVDIDNAIKAFQKLKDNEKFGGPRLDQAFGKGNVDKLLSDLRSYQSQGVHALKARKFLWMAGKILAGTGVGVEAVKGLGSK